MREYVQRFNIWPYFLKFFLTIRCKRFGTGPVHEPWNSLWFLQQISAKCLFLCCMVLMFWSVSSAYAVYLQLVAEGLLNTDHQRRSEVRDRLAFTVAEMGGRRRHEPIPAFHSDPGRPAAVIPSTCLRFTTVITGTCVSQPVCSITWDGAQVTVSLKQCERDSPAVLNIGVPELAYTDAQGQPTPRGHSRLLLRTKTLCL